MTRRMLAALFGALALTLVLAMPASAQEDDDAVVSPAPVVLPDVITRTPEAPVEVKGSTALPTTGGDLGGVALVGLGLTGVGVAFAVGARRRRSSLEAA